MSGEDMTLSERLLRIQSEMKAPKGQYNSFGKYKYRSCEDILEAVKPLLSKYGVTMQIGDQIEMIGDRYYVKATVTLYQKGTQIQSSAYAREAEKKTGMDESQITGTASSYARKYALNGLFLIDDTKDADTDEYTRTAGRQAQQPAQRQKQRAKTEAPGRTEPARPSGLLTEKQVMDIREGCLRHGIREDFVAEKYGHEALDELNQVEYNKLISAWRNICAEWDAMQAQEMGEAEA